MVYNCMLQEESLKTKLNLMVKGKNGILGFSKRKLFGGVILGVLAILLGVGLFLQADRNLYSKFWCFLLIIVGIGDLVGTMYLLRRYRSIVNC